MTLHIEQWNYFRSMFSEVVLNDVLFNYVLQISPVKICDFDLASGLDGLCTSVTTPELQTPVSFS